jgi:glycosyltransferase involved in cell wall biosynthesis
VITAQDPFEMGIVGTVLRAMLRVPLNVQEHGDFFSAPHWRTETVMNRIRYLIGLFVLRRADSVRVVSKRIQDTLIRKGVAPEKISVLPVRTDIQKWINGKTTVDLHAQYPNASPIILTAGRLVAQKNIDVLLLAFAKTVKRLPKALLVIIGTGAEERRLKQKAQTLGISECVVFMPWTDDLVSYMKTADIYALSSDYEGWGRVLVEAMACGLPVVTTDVGCAGEVFIDDRHGKIVPIRDADAFADALIALGLNIEMRQSYRDNALHDIKKLLETSEEDYAHKWVDILMRCRKGI